MKLKKSISLNWKIPVNVFKQNRTGFFPPAPTMHWKESIINETHFNHKATILKKLRLQKIGTPIKKPLVPPNGIKMTCYVLILEGFM